MKPPIVPDPIAASQVLATLNDWRAIMAVLMFIIVALIALIVWGGIIMSGLRKAIDKVADSLWALKLGIAEDRVLGKEDRKLNREDRVLGREERDLSRKEREQ